jgi:hypothetical protein
MKISGYVPDWVHTFYLILFQYSNTNHKFFDFEIFFDHSSHYTFYGFSDYIIDAVTESSFYLPMLSAGSNLPATVGHWAFLVSLLTCSER